MKGCMFFVILLLLGGLGIEQWRIGQLQEDIVKLKSNDSKSNAKPEEAINATEALALMGQIKDAIASTDWVKAQERYAVAKKQIDVAIGTANQTTGPGLRWLRDQLTTLGNEVNRHVPTHS